MVSITYGQGQQTLLFTQGQQTLLFYGKLERMGIIFCFIYIFIKCQNGRVEVDGSDNVDKDLCMC